MREQEAVNNAVLLLCVVEKEITYILVIIITGIVIKLLINIFANNNFSVTTGRLLDILNVFPSIEIAEIGRAHV